MHDVEKEFKPTSWSIDNKVAIYVATVIICLAGIMTYNTLPKENFPEVVFPQIYVATIYPGAPEDIENLISKQIEKQVKSIAGVKKVTSNSLQNFSNVIIEFQTDVQVKEAKREVQEAVDKAKNDLPTDLQDDPIVQDVDISEVPILFLNLSGDYDLATLKEYAEQMQDRIESLKEIRRVDIVGALDREIQVNADLFKMAQAGVDLDDISGALRSENILIAGGQLSVDGMKRSMSVNGEFTSAEQMGNIVVGSTKGGKVYLKDIAEVADTHHEQESFARLDEKNVVTLNVVKRGGENLIDASDQILEIKKDFEENILPKGLKITITGDQSENTRTTLHDLINTIIIGFVLVTIILMFFMGATNAIFVGLSVPISSFIAFLTFPTLGFTLNLMTLFSFLLALGIVVDDAIVVIENTHRVFDNGKVPIRKAAKIAAGEVFMPVLSGTLVVLAPFVPLAFWPGVIGKFMMYLPITLIVALLASLVVAYIMNPVFAADFMKPHDHDHENQKKFTKGFRISLVVFAAVAFLFYMTGSIGLGNFTVFMFGIYSLHRFVLERVISNFQTKAWPAVQHGYSNMITWCLESWKPYLVIVGVVALFIFSIIFTAIRKPPVVFFPKGDPNFIYAYVRMPIGTHQDVTDSITNMVEDKVIKTIGQDTAIVESVISNVSIGASEDQFAGSQVQPHLGKVTVAFVSFAKRNGRSSRPYLDKIRDAVKGISGAEISVDQEQGGPPAGKAINIEIAAEDFDLLVVTADRAKRYLDSLQIPGVEELKSDFQSDKPEIVIKIDREKANREGISTMKIGSILNTAIYGLEVSRFRDVNDDYPIELRIKESQRNDINTLMNLPITYRDMSQGGVVRQVPLSAFATIEYSNSFAGIKRIDQKRVITLSSNVLSDFNPNETVAAIQESLKSLSKPDGISIKMTGEQENQKETSDFLGVAGMVALGLIFMILVIQFNSTSKPLIILLEIVFSVIGVLIGFSLFKMEISIVMSGVGVMALAGIVVRNGILLVEFTDLLISQGIELKAAIIEAAKTRMTPVLLTAMAATLGLIPLAVGFNIDFVTLFTELNPHIFFGGDNVAFWGPLSWTMIFGLIFGTFLTLFMVPVMYLLVARLKARVFKAKPADEHHVAEGTVSEGDVALN
ncbi:efflux RND transporter permease subunit [Chryseolinea lacunae]|uniref:Efflux RND transporter permease subunit n=1 Tax=Chryseolinea lacunae TaxID=2801331 RepID=A0ABS1KPP7_9BACT|nr:efflux RND transporter permease subunit [Chryseolinea lacunae]MBL0741319.1 efflux RND transporter permease subunit [Chryseolinea lacunae]